MVAEICGFDQQNAWLLIEWENCEICRSRSPLLAILN